MIRQVVVLLVAALVMSGLVGAEGLATQKVLTLQAAKAIAAAAESFAKEKGWKVNIAIVDAAGDLLYFQRTLGVQSGSIEVAQRKAESAAKFKRPTKVFSDAIAGQQGLAMVPGALAIEGGLPLAWDGNFLGGIGISGVTSEQDGIIAQAAVDALAEVLK